MSDRQEQITGGKSSQTHTEWGTDGMLVDSWVDREVDYICTIIT